MMVLEEESDADHGEVNDDNNDDDSVDSIVHWAAYEIR